MKGVRFNFDDASIKTAIAGGNKSEIGIICTIDLANKVNWNSISKDDKINWLKSINDYLSSTAPYPDYSYSLSVMYQHEYSGYDAKEIKSW